MTDARIESIRKALGLTEETRKQNARQHLDRTLIEIEHNEGRADPDCLRTISRVVGQLATVEWILREETPLSFWRERYPRRLIGALAISSTLRTFSIGIASFSASSSDVGSRPISMNIWREVRTSFVDRFPKLAEVRSITGLCQLVEQRVCIL